MLQHFFVESSYMPEDLEKLARKTATFEYKYMRKKIIKIFGDHAACREPHAVKQLSLP